MDGAANRLIPGAHGGWLCKSLSMGLIVSPTKDVCPVSFLHVLLLLPHTFPVLGCGLGLFHGYSHFLVDFVICLPLGIALWFRSSMSFGCGDLRLDWINRWKASEPFL